MIITIVNKLAVNRATKNIIIYGANEIGIQDRFTPTEFDNINEDFSTKSAGYRVKMKFMLNFDDG